MRNTIVVLSEQFHDSESLKETILSIAKSIKLNYAINPSGCINMNTGDMTDAMELCFSNEDDFNRNIDEALFPNELGGLIMIHFVHDNATLVPVIRGIFDSYSDLKVYNDEVDGLPLLFNKSDIDAFTGEDAYKCFYTAPEPPSS